MDRLAAMQTFVKVVETGSFSAAARLLRIGQPAVSKAVALLEESLVQCHPVRRENADVDFGFGIVEADAEQTLAMVLHLDQRAVFSRLGQAQD